MKQLIFLLLLFMSNISQGQSPIDRYKQKVDTSITQKRAQNSITPYAVGTRIKELADIVKDSLNEVVGTSFIHYVDTSFDGILYNVRRIDSIYRALLENDKNFANADLVFTANRRHNAKGNTLTFDSLRLLVISADTTITSGIDNYKDTTVLAKLTPLSKIPKVVLDRELTRFPTGGILFGGTDNKLTHDLDNLFYNNITDYLGLGTLSPRFPLHIYKTNSAVNAIQFLEHNVDNGRVIGVYNQGTIYSPQPPVAGRTQLEVGGGSWNGTAFGASPKSSVEFKTSEGHTGVGNGSEAVVHVTKNGTTSRLSPARFADDGSVIVAPDATGVLPDSNVIFNVESSSKGVLLPRLTAAQKKAIISPKSGLTVYETTTGRYSYNNGTDWKFIPTDPDTIGEFFNSINSSDYVVNGTAAWTFNPGYIEVSGITGNNFNNYLSLPYASLTNYTLEVKFVAVSNGNGLAIGAARAYALFKATNDANRGKISIQTTTAANVAASATGLSYANGDTITITLTKVKSFIQFKAKKGTDSIVTSYTYNLAPGASANIWPQSISPVGIWAYGGSTGTSGTQRIVSVKMSSGDFKYNDILFLGDSYWDFAGFYTTDNTKSIANQVTYSMSSKYRTSVINGIGARVDAFYTPEAMRSIRLHNAKHVVIALGINDETVNTIAQYSTNYQRLVDSIKNTGATFSVVNIPPNSTKARNDTAVLYNAALTSAYGTTNKIIDVYTPFLRNGSRDTIYTGDGTHPNARGSTKYASLILKGLAQIGYNISYNNDDERDSIERCLVTLSPLGTSQQEVRINATTLMPEWFTPTLSNYVGGTITTTQPSGSGAGVMKFGKVMTGSDTKKYQQIDIDGTLYYIPLFTSLP